MNKHDHIVCFKEEERQLLIYRIDASGQRTLFTSVVLPETEGWSGALEGFAKQLGENLIMDSPVARKLFGI